MQDTASSQPSASTAFWTAVGYLLTIEWSVMWERSGDRPEAEEPRVPMTRNGMLVRKPVADVFDAFINPDITTKVHQDIGLTTVEWMFEPRLLA